MVRDPWREFCMVADEPGPAESTFGHLPRSSRIVPGDARSCVESGHVGEVERLVFLSPFLDSAGTR